MLLIRLIKLGLLKSSTSKSWCYKKVTFLRTAMADSKLNKGYSMTGSRNLTKSNQPSIDANRLPTIEVEEKAFQYKVTMPGFSFADLTRAGHVGVWNLARFGESCRMVAYNPNYLSVKQPYPNFMYQLFKERLVFMVSCQYDFRQEFYDKAHHFKPIIYSDQVANVGKSSFQHISDGVSTFTGKKLFDSITYMVFVDKTTRQPVPFPDWFTKEVNNKAPTPDVPRVTKMESPATAQSVSYVMQPSDADYYGHANQASYAKICHDAACELARGDKLTYLKGDLAEIHIDHFSGLYMGESNAGDTMHTRVWENPADHNTLHFDTYNSRSEKSTFQATMKFTDSRSSISKL